MTPTTPPTSSAKFTPDQVEGYRALAERLLREKFDNNQTALARALDIHNTQEVEWAVATRFQADRDLLIVPNSQGSRLDPSNRNGVGAKMGIDATKPLDAAEMVFKRIHVPGEEAIDTAALLKQTPGDWREAVKG